MNFKKLISAVLALILLCTAIPVSVLAEGEASAINPSHSLITEITYPVSVNYTYNINEDGTITITGYDSVPENFDGLLYVPREYDGYSVSAIGNNAFKSNTEITRLIVSGYVKSIEAYAFYGCSELTSICLYKGVETVGQYAFRECKKLKNITLSDGIKKIDQYAFYNCTALTELNLPNSLEEIGLGIVQGCSSITKMSVPFTGNTRTKNTYFSWVFGDDQGGDRAGYVVPYGFNELYFNEGCTTIPTSAVYRCGTIDTVIIPKTVTEIKTFAFYKCSALGSIVLYPGVTLIDSFAFYDNNNLGEIYIPDSVTKIASSNFKFYNGTKMRTVIKCYPDSYAHNYAVSNGLNYQLLTRYDASGDGAANAEDMTVLRKHLVYGGAASYESDCNCDGNVDVLDLVKIKKFLAVDNI